MLIEKCLCGGRTYSTCIPVLQNDTALPLLVASCVNCGTKWAVTDETKDEIADWYRSGAYHNDTTRHANVIDYRKRYYDDRKAAEKRLARYAHILEPRRFWAPYDTWLDVGCAKGAFVDVAVDRGFKATGVDVDAVFAREFGPVIAGDVLSVEPAAWGFVSYHDVLEHMPDPRAELERAVSRIRPGGILIVEVPDVHVEAGEKHFKREHLWYFTLRTLVDVVRDVGLEVIAFDFPIPGKLTVFAWQRP